MASLGATVADALLASLAGETYSQSIASFSRKSAAAWGLNQLTTARVTLQIVGLESEPLDRTRNLDKYTFDIAVQKFKEAGFSEADATKVQVGQTATITFDSLPATRLTAKVASVDVTPTTVSNVVTYYAYFAFDQPPADGTVKIIDVRTRAVVARWEHTGAVSAAFAPDGARLAVNGRFASGDQEIREGDEVALIGLVSGG